MTNHSDQPATRGYSDGNSAAVLIISVFMAFAIFVLGTIAVQSCTGMKDDWHDKVNDRLATLEARPTATCVVLDQDICLVPRETPEREGQ